MVVDYRVESGAFIPGKPRLWSDKRVFYAGTSNLDLAPDGKRFLVLMTPEPATGERNPVHITILLNFFDEVKQRIPGEVIPQPAIAPYSNTSKPGWISLHVRCLSRRRRRP